MAEIRRIQLLSDRVINKIAAGEVVERPASVLKELMENAIDAGARHIEVEIVAGGRNLISISDDGSGMSRDDALLSVERHATSKIRDIDDVEQVSTLGFRGEALAAIASVAQFSLSTRTADADSGTELIISGGKIQEVRDVGCPVGATIKVRHLFFNVPARRKFLRSDQTELGHLRQIFIVFGLSHFSIAMRLSVDGREVYQLASCNTMEDRLRDLFGPELIQALRRVDFSSDRVSVTGYAGLPQVGRADRSEQYIFINKRYAGAPVLSYAINEAYHTLLPKGRYPSVFLNIDVPPTSVDVNVHPTKKEVRFRNPSQIRDAVIGAIRQALSNQPVLSGMGRRDDVQSSPVTQAMPEPMLRIEDMPSPRTFNYPKLPMASHAAGPSGERATTVSANSDYGKAPWSWCRILGQVGGLYVIMETEDGLVLMDPHAAHERLLYEEFMKGLLKDQVKSQGLLTPETIRLMPGEASRVRENLVLLKKMGLGIAEFGNDTFIIDALPICLGNASPSSILTAVAQSLEQAGARGGTERWAEEGIAQAACKAAVKARDSLRLDEIEQLVVDLARAEMPYTCPHGRPTLIFMSFSELHKKFGRI